MFDRLVPLILKELQLLLRDPQSRRLLIVPVVLQLVLFPFAATLEVKNSTLAVYNQDQGARSIELLQRFARAAAFPKLDLVHSERELTEAIDSQSALIALQFPADFSRRIEANGSAPIQAVLDGRKSNSAQVALGYLSTIVSDYVAERGESRGATPSSTLIVRNRYNPNLEYSWFVLPSLVAIITTIGSLVVTALSVAREREQGTFDQLLVSPLTPGLIMLGKAVPAAMVALVQGSVIAAAAVFVFGVPFTGSVLVLYFSMLVYALSLAGFGLLISSVCSTQQQAFLGVFTFVVPAVMLSGYIAPVENMPPLLRGASYVDPLRHFIVIVKGLFLKSYDFSLVWPNLLPLLGIALLTMTLAYIVFRRRSG